MYREKFLPIKDYENLYKISNAGRVKSLERKAKHSRGNGYRTVRGRILKSGIGSHGYEIVNLSKNGKIKSYSIHRLLADAFIPNTDPEHLTDIDHIRNGDKTCNFTTSLEWVTKSENELRSYRRDGRKGPMNGITGMRAVLKINKITDKILAEFESGCKAERETKIHQSSIYKCCKGQRKTAGGYIWKYVLGEKKNGKWRN